MKVFVNLLCMRSTCFLWKLIQSIACHAYTYMQLYTLCIGWLYLLEMRAQDNQILPMFPLYICLHQNVEQNDNVLLQSEMILQWRLISAIVASLLEVPSSPWDRMKWFLPALIMLLPGSWRVRGWQRFTGEGSRSKSFFLWAYVIHWKSFARTYFLNPRLRNLK